MPRSHDSRRPGPSQRLLAASMSEICFTQAACRSRRTVMVDSIAKVSVDCPLRTCVDATYEHCESLVQDPNLHGAQAWDGAPPRDRLSNRLADLGMWALVHELATDSILRIRGHHVGSRLTGAMECVDGAQPRWSACIGAYSVADFPASSNCGQSDANRCCTSPHATGNLAAPLGR